MSLKDFINQNHQEAKALGWRLLQPYRYGEDDASHVRKLLKIADFDQNAKVLDIGCGIGECARLMKGCRDDLSFTLLNFSEEQLKDCPDEFERILGDAHDLTFDECSFDSVMFNASLGNMDYKLALSESVRVLKVGGTLLINEPERISGTNDDMQRILMFSAYTFEQINNFCSEIGMSLEKQVVPFEYTEYLKDQWASDEYDIAFEGVRPSILKFTKIEHSVACKVGKKICSHERVAMQVSGGKDSLSVLHLLKPWWDRLTVYWLNTGDAVPATTEMMAGIRKIVPNFIEVQGRQPETIRDYGWPSDVVPQSHTVLGNQILGKTPFLVQERLSCCVKSIMLPMHERMLADGVSLVIRGKRGDDADKTGVKSGDKYEYELLFPIQDWTEKDVYLYLEDSGFPLPDYYQSIGDSMDCKTCTAWSNHRANRYLKDNLPEAHTEKTRRQKLILNAIKNDLALMIDEVS